MPALRVQIPQVQAVEPDDVRESAPAPRFVGKVGKKFLRNAFVECADTFAVYGKDVYVMPSIVGDDVFRLLQLNDEVSFEVDASDPRGPRAIQFEVLSTNTVNRYIDTTVEGFFPVDTAEYNSNIVWPA